MPLWKNTQHSFAAGQLDAYIMGRQDMDKYARGATKLKNFLVKRQGCISKRRGTDETADLAGLLGSTYTGDPIDIGKIRLVPVTNGHDGRYVILSGGIGFVADRDGIRTTGNNRVRSIIPYTATDIDGKPVSVFGKDARQNAETPFDCIHRVGPGNYVVTRHASLQEAFDTAVDGDTVKLHNNYTFDEKASEYGSNEISSWPAANLRSEKFTFTDGGTGTMSYSMTGTYPENNQWNLTRNGTTYKSCVSGRYQEIPYFDLDQPTIRANQNWTFSDGGEWTMQYVSSRWRLSNGTNYYWNLGTGDPYKWNEVSFTVGDTTVTATRTWTYDKLVWNSFIKTTPVWHFSDTAPSSAFTSRAWTLDRSGSTWKLSRAGTQMASVTGASSVVTFQPYSYNFTVTCDTPYWTFSDGGNYTCSFTNGRWNLKQNGSTISSVAGASTDNSITFAISDDVTVTATLNTTTAVNATVEWVDTVETGWKVQWRMNGYRWLIKGSESYSKNATISSTSVVFTTATSNIGNTIITASAEWQTANDLGYHVAWNQETNKYEWGHDDYYTFMYNTAFSYSDFKYIQGYLGANRQKKHVTFDLNGYRVTCINVPWMYLHNKAVHLTITSSRQDTKITMSVVGSLPVLSGYQNASLTLEGDIQWFFYGQYGISMIRGGTFTINGGKFYGIGSISGSMIDCGGATTTINDGNFILDNKSTSGAPTIFAGGITTDYSQQPITINGGYFCVKGNRLDSCYWLISNHKKLTINGGRFDISRDIFMRGDMKTAIHPVGSSFYNHPSMAKLVRGEFTFNEITYYMDGKTYPLADYGVPGTVANETNPNEDGFYGVKQTGEADYVTTSSQGLTPYRFVIPYADKDLHDLCIRQSGDTLFIAHREYPPAKIYFDTIGRAYWEELSLDNTDFYTPIIDSAVMVGNEPKETDNWPLEFTTEKPSWLSSDQKAAVTTFMNACKALGVVTDAGYNGNNSTGTDNTYSRACSYTCTSVAINRTTGVKTTTVSVKSFTASKVIQNSKEATTSGSAENSAAATTALVSRTVRYVATYVKNGKESRPSAPFAVDYDMPWANNAVVNLMLSKGANNTEPEYYNIYKDNGNGYGLIGTVGVDKVMGGAVGMIDTYPLLIADNRGDNGLIMNVADFEEKKGWAVGDIMRKLTSINKDKFTASPESDICLITTKSNYSKGIEIEIPKGGSAFDRIRILLDGRLYDKQSQLTYLIPSMARVKCTLTYTQIVDGNETTGTINLTEQPNEAYRWEWSPGFWWSNNGTPKEFYGLQQTNLTTPNGDKLKALVIGEGDQADYLNTFLRPVDFDFTSQLKAIDSLQRITKINFQFGDNGGYQDTYFEFINTGQGVIHEIHFYKGSQSATTGMFQDDYINPDMTVTPPDDSQDPHFSTADDYPGCVGIYEQRLVFASTNNNPSTIYMSRTADIYNFTPHEAIREDDAMELTLAATEFPNINHLITGRDMMLFGDGGEWLVSPISGNALTYKTASAKLQSMIGSEPSLSPIQLADETLFTERGGTCLRSINYNYSSDSYQSVDLSVIAQSIFRANPIVSMAYKQHPDSIVECVLKDGSVATLVYMKEQEVAAWSVHVLGGGWKAREIATPKCIQNGTTEMMLLVERNGAYRLWKVRDDDDSMTAAAQATLDGIRVLKDTATADNDTLAVPLGNNTFAVGYPIEAEFESVRPEPTQGPTAQMEIKNATEAEIRVIAASTFNVSSRNSSIASRVDLPVIRQGEAVTLAEKDCKRLLAGTNNRDGRITVRHTEPWPLTILSISNTYQIEYENKDGGDQ